MADTGLSRGDANLLFGQIFPKTAWKWRNFGPLGPASLAPPRSVTDHEVIITLHHSRIFHPVSGSTTGAPHNKVISAIRFHNSSLNSLIKQQKFLKTLTDMTRDRIQVICIVVSYSNHYTKAFSVLGWHCK